MQDMYSLLYLPFFVSVWVSAILAAPALGPILSGFAVVVENWRWSLWEILWLAGPVFVLWFFCLPETSASNILLRQSMRLRKLSQNPNISSQSQTDRRGLTASAIALDALIKAFEIMFKDPAVLFTNVYTALIYGIYYSFFEVFPLVYGPLYGFNIGETGVVITCIIVACVLAMGIYFYYLQYMLIPDTSKNGLRAQESRLRLALIFVWGPLIGPFILAGPRTKMSTGSSASLASQSTPLQSTSSLSASSSTSRMGSTIFRLQDLEAIGTHMALQLYSCGDDAKLHWSVIRSLTYALPVDVRSCFSSLVDSA